jgi:hypothetical protein
MHTNVINMGLRPEKDPETRGAAFVIRVRSSTRNEHDFREVIERNPSTLLRLYGTFSAAY